MFQNGKLSRRMVLAGAGLAASFAMLGQSLSASAGAKLYRKPREKEYPLFDEATAHVVPASGYQSKVALKDSIIRCVREGVISRDKYNALAKAYGEIPAEFSTILTAPAAQPISLTRANASRYVNLLWAVGLSNRLDSNKDSPVNGPDLENFASTGGWSLGKAPRGGEYFNKFSIIDLKPEEEALAVRAAKNTYRPCCNNSTFFQDCNHGSALFAILQLGASQGLSEAQLYNEALAYNSFWFPDYYIATALYFKVVRKTNWHDADARTVAGADFSSASGWQENVLVPLEAYADLFPPPEGGANCGT